MFGEPDIVTGESVAESEAASVSSEASTAKTGNWEIIKHLINKEVNNCQNSLIITRIK